MAGVSSSIRLVNKHLLEWIKPDLIDDKCREVGYTFRDRVIGPYQTILLGILMILGANASQATGRIMAGASFSVQALNKALHRLPLALLEAVSTELMQASKLPRVLLVDVCNYYLPDSPELRKHYKHPRQKKKRNRRCDYPQIRVLSVIDLHSGALVAQFDFPSDRHESPMLELLTKIVREGDTLVFDRGFVSYANVCRLQFVGIHFVARVPSNLKAGQQGSRGRRRFVHPGRRGSGQVVWKKPAHASKGICNKAWKNLPASLTLRQVTQKVPRGRSRGNLILITDLPKAAARQISSLYRRRWEIETDFRHLKTTLKLEFFRTRSVEGVRRELLFRQIAYNVVRRAMRVSGRQQRVSCHRVSFRETVQALLFADVDTLLRLTVLPERIRSGRVRKMKYRGKNYGILKKQPEKQRCIA